MDREIAIPEGIDIRVDRNVVVVRGPKGSLEKDFASPVFMDTIKIEKEGSVLKIMSKSDKRKFKAMAGTIQSHVKNMILGVTAGYKYTMKISYSHFPISVAVKGKEIHIKNFLGEKGLRIADVSGNCSIAVDKEDIAITGISVEEVGQTASNIEQACKITGRDRRVFQDGIFIAGKFLQDGREL